MKIACITLDFEMDYDDYVGEFNILKENKKEILALAQLFKKQAVPVSVFIRTDLLTRHPECIPIIRKLGTDFHSHSHTHFTKTIKKGEISNSTKQFKEIFGYQPLGYRAPLGVLHKNSVSQIKKSGYKFSASIFPSYWPGRFNNLGKSMEPFQYQNGLWELPFAAIPKIRYIISLSYLKLLGIRLNEWLFNIFGLPETLIFDSHLHDYIVNETSFNKLPLVFKLGWSRNKYSGVEYYVRFIKLLRKRGYKFMTVTELYKKLDEQSSLSDER